MTDENNKILTMDPDQMKEIEVGIGQHLRFMRERSRFSSVKEITQGYEKVAAYGTYHKMEDGDTKTSFKTFIEVFHLFNGTDRDAAILFGNHPSQTYISTDHDHSDAHLSRLRKYTRTKYNFWFMNEENKPQELKVAFRQIINDSYVAGDGKLEDELDYDCKLISPSNSGYSFIYFSCISGLIDKALFIIPYVEQIRHKFKQGIGLMISVSIEKPRCPEVKKFVMMKSSLPKPDDIVLETSLQVHDLAVSDYMIRFPTIGEANSNFVKL